MNQKSLIAVLGVIVVILIGTTVYFASINKANQPVSPDPKVVQQPAPTPAVQQPAQQVPSSDIATNKTPEQIVRGVLTPEQKATNPEITIVKATDSFIKNDPDKLQKFLKVHVEATDYVNTHKNETATIVSKKLGTNVDVELEARNHIEFIAVPTSDFENNLMKLVQVQKQLGYVKNNLTMDQVFNLNYLP